MDSDALFDAIDLNRNGTIEDTELLLHLIKEGVDQETIDTLFRALDADDDGHITREEWKRGFGLYLRAREGTIDDALARRLEEWNLNKYAGAFARTGFDMLSDLLEMSPEELERVADPVTLAQKILSTVVRTGQSWGVGHVIDVLRGRTSEQVTARRHHELTTFGLLADLSIAELRGYVDQLTQQDLLVRTDGPYPVLQLTEDGVGALKGETDLALFRQPRPSPSQRRAPPACQTVGNARLSP